MRRGLGPQGLSRRSSHPVNRRNEAESAARTLQPPGDWAVSSVDTSPRAREVNSPVGRPTLPHTTRDYWMDARFRWLTARIEDRNEVWWGIVLGLTHSKNAPRRWCTLVKSQVKDFRVSREGASAMWRRRAQTSKRSEKWRQMAETESGGS
jgi:hypothetical protein